MIFWVNLCLVGGVAYLGIQTLSKRKTKNKKGGLVQSDRPADKQLLPLSTRAYIVRVWKEQNQRNEQPVTRYALTVPSTGLRSGFSSSEALLETLSKELART